MSNVAPHLRGVSKPITSRAAQVTGSSHGGGHSDHPASFGTEPTAFTAASPPDGNDLTAYTYTFVANGSPIKYVVEDGALPTGCTLNSATGVLSSTTVPTAGEYTFKIKAINSFGQVITDDITVTITDVEAPAAFSADNPPDGDDATPYTYTFIADGDPAPTYSKLSGDLPTGATLTGATGVLAGATLTAGEYTFKVRATNAYGHVDTADITVTITHV